MRKNLEKKKLVLHRETLQNLAAVLGGDLTRLSGCQGAYCETGTNCNISLCICD